MLSEKNSSVLIGHEIGLHQNSQGLPLDSAIHFTGTCCKIFQVDSGRAYSQSEWIGWNIGICLNIDEPKKLATSPSENNQFDMSFDTVKNIWIFWFKLDIGPTCGSLRSPSNFGYLLHQCTLHVNLRRHQFVRSTLPPERNLIKRTDLVYYLDDLTMAVELCLVSWFAHGFKDFELDTIGIAKRSSYQAMERCRKDWFHYHVSPLRRFSDRSTQCSPGLYLCALLPMPLISPFCFFNNCGTYY